MRRAALSSKRGFTLIEILTVITIIVILVAITITAVGSLQIRAKQKKTEVMVEAVNNALQSYFADFRDYPPDGFDPVPGFTVDANGVQLPDVQGNPNAAGYLTIDPTTIDTNTARKNSSALIYFLMLRHRKVSRMGADGTAGSFTSTRSKIVGPYLPIQSLDADNFSARLAADNRTPDLGSEVCELVDGFGWPLEYDRVRTVAEFNERVGNNASVFHRDGNLTALIGDLITATGGADFCPSGSHPVAEALEPLIDPRRPVLSNDDGCSDLSPGAVRSINIGSFDVWSHGRSWTNPRDDIGNFRGK